MYAPDLDPIDFAMTPQERDQAAIVHLHLERNRCTRNTHDKAADEAAARGNAARLGVVWPDDPPRAA